MSHRDIVKSDFVGKTITDLDCEAVNIITFTFEGGTKLAIEIDAVGPGIYGMVACDVCADQPIPARSQSTTISDSALNSVVDLWSRTSCPSKGRDLYLALVSTAGCLPYDTCVALFKEHDDGIIRARRYVKRRIFAKLLGDPGAVLQVHDATLVK